MKDSIYKFYNGLLKGIYCASIIGAIGLGVRGECKIINGANYDSKENSKNAAKDLFGAAGLASLGILSCFTAIKLQDRRAKLSSLEEL